jgi:hypothetical protein
MDGRSGKELALSDMVVADDDDIVNFGVRPAWAITIG